MNPKQPSKIMRLGVFWAIIIVAGLILWAVYAQPQNLKDVPFSEVVKRANSGEIAKIEIQDNELKITPFADKDSGHPTQRSRKEGGSSIYEQGLNHNTKAEVVIDPPSDSSLVWNLATIILVLTSAIMLYLLLACLRWKLIWHRFYSDEAKPLHLSRTL